MYQSYIPSVTVYSSPFSWHSPGNLSKNNEYNALFSKYVMNKINTLHMHIHTCLGYLFQIQLTSYIVLLFLNQTSTSSVSCEIMEMIIKVRYEVLTAVLLKNQVLMDVCCVIG
jgi:hypothetical protein